MKLIAFNYLIFDTVTTLLSIKIDYSFPDMNDQLSIYRLHLPAVRKLWTQCIVYHGAYGNVYIINLDDARKTKCN